jgi:hypothetical protein
MAAAGAAEGQLESTNTAKRFYQRRGRRVIPDTGSENLGRKTLNFQP